ncbi:hypothetical protein HBH56_120410 [Parastagonospora nodorum]|uniref:C3H1-type domain-containing protein n=2 Tax=Phaeosphaeria nodorum (strain SN15 / ATCC MYA-4574 / FGSC 10173) TaxID=321614 RepID=A0A7U2FF30_PHANO|nr:hypothetical protein SNOG_13829 [Parastagonospora nodorum SN15]KAH3912004.1 hypothetical protein HBH56_120410 [Parastagonospora nodorum]EAT78853.1 hypothetical protein SNOG_13829 [Parastagonospora nodorum SN15]KAH3924306.1 hypothetical protein HBH54_196310 [Parastagonospora nodorum]KAH3968315.1 hypothetical protein HBH52_178760 [Parastagonospora nodorum]KAH3993370.1 hypothetical protein HBI10_202240 [Parastagonospora nodorum]
MDCQPSDTDRGEPTYTEPPRGDDCDKSLPKNFDKPLTCFFWYQTGRCSKRDIDCIYAHYDTGYYAAGPIHVARPTGTIAVAGRNARQMSSTNAPLQILPSIADLHLKAARLAAWEQELMRREASVTLREQQLNSTLHGGRPSRARRQERGARNRGELRTVDRRRREGAA